MAEAPDKPFDPATLKKERKKRAEQAERDARPYRGHPTVTWGEWKKKPYNEQRRIDYECNHLGNVERVKVACATGQDCYVTRTKQPEPIPATPPEPPRPPLVLTPLLGKLPRFKPRLHPRARRYYKPYHTRQLALPFPA